MFSQVLAREQILKIHETSLRILGEIGVQLPHEELLGRFADAGASVDHESQRVRIPAELVERCLASCKKQFTIYGRDTFQRAEFGVGKRNYNSIAGEAHWVDTLGGPRRPARLADAGVASRLGDALDSINIVGAMSDADDVPKPVACVEVMAEQLRNTTKPITFWFHDRPSAKYLIEMMVAVRGSEAAAREYPLCYPFLEPISPLRFPSNGVDCLFEAARLNLAVPIGPMAQMGLSAPCTIAGTMAQENAEILAGICVVELIQEGTPVCYGGIPHAFDMGTTQLIFCGPEQAILGVGMTQMGKHYGLPVYINVGLTDSKLVDGQAGIESALTLMLGAAAGADIFGHMGICGVDQGSSLDMLVFHDEVISFVESVMRGIDFSDEALGYDEVAEVGPGGSYISRDHTALNFRKELWFPKLLDRQFYDAWRTGGARSTQERCAERRQELLESHEPEPLDDSMSAAIDEVVAAARRDLLKVRS